MRKYLYDTYSPEELTELLGYLQEEDDALYEEITARLWQENEPEKTMADQKADALINNAVQTGAGRNRWRLSLPWYRVVAAAVWMLVVGIGIRYLSAPDGGEPAKISVQSVNRYKNDIPPGRTKAILKAGSAQVVLNKEDTSFRLAGNTVSVKQGDVKVAGEKPVQYTLITPKGGQYSLVLGDGTKVWLNAASTLIYPSEFNDGIRRVELVGEAYFEVKTDPAHPFIVHTEDQDIRVLGTAFNVQAYPDESKSVTTLVHGKVRVDSKGKTLSLEHGQQAVLAENGTLRLHAGADVEQAVAWKRGYFQFDYTDIYEVMRRLARWYDVEVEYEEGVPHREFIAFINRDNKISQVLEMLEATGEIRFAIDGHKVTVMKGDG